MESQAEDDRRLMEALLPLPGVVERAGDIVVKLGGKGPVVDQLAKRLKPPGVEEDGEPTAEDLKQQLQAMGQQLQVKEGQLQEAAKIIETKQIEADARIKVADKQASSSITVALINAQAKGLEVDAKLEADLIKQATDIMATAAQTEAEHEHVDQSDAMGHERQMELTKMTQENKAVDKPNGKV